MKGIHINWTKPYLLKNNTTEYKQKQYEKLVQLLSVLYWKKFYGDIVLYTDKLGFDYYSKCGYPFLELYDDVKIDLLDSSSVNTINPQTFWAGGKIFSIREEKTPFVMLDLDLFLTDDIKDQFKDQDLVFSHFETLNDPVYPNPKSLCSPSYELPKYDWSILPGNVCVTYFGNESFKDRYTSEAICYMRSFQDSNSNGENIDRMVFAEQRLLTTIAYDMGIKYKPLINDIYNSRKDLPKYQGSNIDTGEEPSWIHIGNSNIKDIPIHHTWGYKQMLVNKGLRLLYVEQLQNTIKKDFPEYQKYLEDPNNE